MIATNTRDRALVAEERYLDICDKIKSGPSGFLNGLGATDISGLKTSFIYAGVADERNQIATVIPLVWIGLVLFDDHVFVEPRFL
jgi:hypothetical protein